MTHYLVAVLTQRRQAEAAYAALQRDDVPAEQLSLLGQGYQSADDYGLIHPDRQAKHWSQRLLYGLIPFGFAAGFAFNWLTGIQILPVNPWINHALGGLFGAIAGSMGALFVGGATGWTVASGDAIAYRNRLNAGKYLIITEGSDRLIREATRILRRFEPENLQGYTATS